jgi:adenine deaminase
MTKQDRTGPITLPSIAETRDLMDVAMGRAGADLVIEDADVVNVYTGEVQPNLSICVKGERIACITPDPSGMVAPNTTVISGAGRTVIPGLIDGHTHIAWLFTAAAFVPYALKGGATTVVSETMESYPVGGIDGVLDFLDSLRDQPMKFFATAPTMASISRAAAGIDEADLARLLSREDVIGLGESYWQSILQKRDRFLPEFQETLKAGKTLEGHSAGARGKKLMAYAAAGVSSCHEPITADEVLERLRLGMHVMIREGSIRADLKPISQIKDAGIDFRRLILATDGVEPADLIEKGYMASVLQKAIDYGFPPVTAVQMATLNVAEHFGLDRHIGGLGPGRYADMLILPDLATIDPEYVVSNGRIVVQTGELQVEPRSHRFTEASRRSIRLDGEMTASDFAIRIDDKTDEATVRVMEMITDLVTQETRMTAPVRSGEIDADPKKDLLKVAAVDRRIHPGKTFTGLIKGFGLQKGALAASAAWDCSDIIVAGASGEEMAAAVNRIRELRGGVVLCVDGKVTAELALPILGLLSELTIPELADAIAGIKAAAAELGVSFADPLLTLVTLTGAAIPYFRICEEGLVNLKDGKTVGVVVEG